MLVGVLRLGVLIMVGCFCVIIVRFGFLAFCLLRVGLANFWFLRFAGCCAVYACGGWGA